jgi:ATP-dependent Lon protease
MGTDLEIILPEEIPVMTLPQVAFFPQALLPLHIFEPRYREMLKEVLATNRLMAIAGMDQRPGRGPEAPFRVAGVGIIRACQGNDDGTSNLLVQGLCRAAVEEIVAEEPFRRIRIRALTSDPGADAAVNERSRDELARLLRLKQRLSSLPEGKMAAFLKTVDDPETFVDIAAFSLCDSPAVKQKLLETLDVHRRLELFAGQLRSEIEQLRVQRRLQGGISDDKIGEN